MPLDLRIQKRMDGYSWVLSKGKHVMSRSARFYPTYRAVRLSLISLIKSIQADNFIVYDETEDAPRPSARKRRPPHV